MRIQHEDRIVLCAFYKQAKALFALAQFSLGFSAFSNVAEYQHYAGDFSLCIANRRSTIINGSFSSILGNKQSVIG